MQQHILLVLWSTLSVLVLVSSSGEARVGLVMRHIGEKWFAELLESGPTGGMDTRCVEVGEEHLEGVGEGA